MKKNKSFIRYLVEDGIGQNLLIIPINLLIINFSIWNGVNITMLDVLQNHLLMIITLNIYTLRQQGDEK